MKFKNLNCEDAKEMGVKVRELTDIVCRKCGKHSDLVETINLQRSAIKQRDTEINILIRKKESLRDEIEELKLKISELEIELKEKSLWDNLQKAEIEGLRKRIVFWREDLDYRPKEIQAEAINKFAEEVEKWFVAGGISPAFVKATIKRVKEEVVGEKDV